MTIDLSYLKSMTDGDMGLIKELIGIFSTQVEEYGMQMGIFLDEKNWKELGKIAHKAKSSVAIMGMNELAEEMKELELLTGKEEATHRYASYVNSFTSQCQKAVIELQHYK